MSTAQDLHLPFDWTITPESENADSCPGSSIILGTFAAVSAVAGVVSLIFGNRLIVNKLTLGLLGKPDSDGWLYLWVLSLGLHLGANALIARLIQTTPGYLSTFSIAELMIVFTTRPRLGWIFLIATQLGRWGAGPELETPTPSIDPEQPTSLAEPDFERPTLKSSSGSRWDLWTSSTLTTLFSEVALQIMAFYPMGMVARFGATRGFLLVWGAEYPLLPHSSRLMYAGAMLYLVFGALCLILVLLVIVGLLLDSWALNSMSKSITSRGEGTGRPYHDLSETRRGRDLSRDAVIALVVLCLPASTWMASWLFWAGFVQVAGDRYCPPNLLAQGAVWSSASAMSAFFGASA